MLDSWGGLNFLVILNNASMNVALRISVQVPAFNSFGYIEVELLDHMLTLPLIF